MVEVGLVFFAKRALAVVQEVPLPYGSKFSGHTFAQIQPAGLACMCTFFSCVRIILLRCQLRQTASSCY